MDGMRCVEIDKMVGRTETYRISMAYSNYTTLYVVTNTDTHSILRYAQPKQCPFDLRRFVQLFELLTMTISDLG